MKLRWFSLLRAEIVVTKFLYGLIWISVSVVEKTKWQSCLWHAIWQAHNNCFLDTYFVFDRYIKFDSILKWICVDLYSKTFLSVIFWERKSKRKFVWSSPTVLKAFKLVHAKAFRIKINEWNRGYKNNDSINQYRIFPVLCAKLLCTYT